MTGFFKIAMVVLLGGALHLASSVTQITPDASAAASLASEGFISIAG
jgi:hypothetical protein